jgi:hypothetical protein
MDGRSQHDMLGASGGSRGGAGGRRRVRKEKNMARASTSGKGISRGWCGVVAAVAFLLGWLLGRGEGGTRVYVERDTVVQVREVPRVVYVARAKRVVVRDTVVMQVRPFVAEHDTVIGGDSVRTVFYYPEYAFGVWLRRAPDTLITVYQRELMVPRAVGGEREPWWREVLRGVAFVGAGYVLGRLSP